MDEVEDMEGLEDVEEMEDLDEAKGMAELLHSRCSLPGWNGAVPSVPKKRIENYRNKQGLHGEQSRSLRSTFFRISVSTPIAMLDVGAR